MFKIGCLVMLIVALAFIGLSVGTQISCEDVQSKLSGVEDAKFIIQTTSRAYYTNDYSKEDGFVILHGFWEIAEGRWVKRDNDLKVRESIIKYIGLSKKGME